MEVAIQFSEGINEQVVPMVKLTRSKDGSTGTATFVFYRPTIFDKNMSQSDIVGMSMLDEEGKLITRNIRAKYINGKPESIEVIYIMKNREAWDRFMRFMERYSSLNNLSFTKSN